MISTRILNKTIRELHEISGTDFLLSDRKGRILVRTADDLEPDQADIRKFMDSASESQALTEVSAFKIPDADSPDYILLSRGDQAALFGQIAVSELRNLLEASGERTDQNHFIQNVLLDNLRPLDIRNEARRLRIREDLPRMVFLIETSEDDNELARQTLRAIYTASRGSDFITHLDLSHLAVVRELSSGDPGPAALKTAHTLSDMLNTEAMISVRIACGSPVSTLTELSGSCREAQLALEIGRIFYPDRRIISYDRLGIGRLIHQLPESLCRQFLRESFPPGAIEELTDEDLSTVRIFLNNNLNISETARQLYTHRNTLVYRLEKLEKLTGLDIRRFEDAMTFHIALMVREYMKSRQD